MLAYCDLICHRIPSTRCLHCTNDTCCHVPFEVFICTPSFQVAADCKVELRIRLCVHDLQVSSKGRQEDLSSECQPVLKYGDGESIVLGYWESRMTIKTCKL